MKIDGSDSYVNVDENDVDDHCNESVDIIDI